MKENELVSLFLEHPELRRLQSLICGDGSPRIRLKGITASAKAFLTASVFTKYRATHLVICPEKEDAAYYYNDLAAMLGDESVFFFPSTYKRSVQYEQTEPANIVLRTEVLNQLSAGRRKMVIVSYPESLMEKVVSKRTLKKNTFPVSRGDRVSVEFLEELLQEYGFQRQDFVYEPGQYAIRGSIFDLFSYSAELPFRIDFSGEEIDSIRTFNPDDQLSVNILDKISIIPNIQDISVDIIMSEGAGSYIQIVVSMLHYASQ